MSSTPPTKPAPGAPPHRALSWWSALQPSRVPYTVFLLSLLLTALATVLSIAIVQREEESRFDALATSVQAVIEQRMAAYSALLRSSAGLFLDDRRITPQQFEDYARRLQLRQTYPGTLGIGWATHIRETNRQRTLEYGRTYAETDYRFRTASGQGEPATAVVYLYPKDRPNRAALGFDMASEPLRAAAMDLARDTNAAATTGRIDLSLESGGNPQPGFTIYFPVYEGGGEPSEVEDRRRRIRGFVFTPLRSVDLFSALLQDHSLPVAADGVQFAVYSGDGLNPEHLLFATKPNASDRSRGPQLEWRPPLQRGLPLDIPGRKWMLICSTSPGSSSGVRMMLVPLVLMIGLLLSLGLLRVSLGQEEAQQNSEEALEKLRQSEERLRDANRAKDQFLAMLGHELRNPLAAVTRSISVLRSATPGGAEAARAWRVMDRQIRHQARLVDDLLDVSRVTSGKIRMKEQLLDLNQVAEAAAAVITGAARERGHHLELRLHPEPIPVKGDPIRLEQVLTNLLTNSIKYTPPGGSIRLDLSTLPGAPGEAGHACVSVRDTGIGIAPELLPRIFDIFAQADISVDRASGGLGLGLTLVERLVTMHGGYVQAFSRGEGQGAEFRICLPLASAGELQQATAAPPRAEVQEEPAPHHRLRIAVVEDNADLRETMCDLLHLWDHDALPASTGPEAVEMVTREWPDLVLLDIGLPGMSGYEVARALRAAEKEHGRAAADQSMTIIALTGYGQPGDADQSLAAGCDDHLVKPCSSEKLRAVLEEEQARRRPRNESQDASSDGTGDPAEQPAGEHGPAVDEAGVGL